MTLEEFIFVAISLTFGGIYTIVMLAVGASVGYSVAKHEDGVIIDKDKL